LTIEPNIIVDAIKEPVTVAEAKLHTRDDYSESDALYAIWIAAARDYVEAHAGITVHEKTLEITLDHWPMGDQIILPRATPLISVTSMIYYDTDGTPTTMTPTTEYLVDIDSKPGRIVLPYSTSWPSTTLRPANGIRIRYKAGIATASPETECSAAVKHPVLMLVNAYDRNRSAESVPDRATMSMIALRYGADAFIERLRVESNTY
jgi:uncharacterized phiE125 gp8 family phage protein